jgi:hypothetical protein
MAPTTISLILPEAEVNEAKEAALAFTGLPATATGKELLAAVVNEVIRKWRIETKGAAKGQVT